MDRGYDGVAAGKRRGQQRAEGPAPPESAPAREQELTKRQREMVALYYDQGMTMPQIAERLGVSRSTVSRTLRRARDRLYRFLRYTL